VKYRAVILPRADLDQAEIYSYLAQQSAAIAHRFLDSVEQTIQGVCSTTTPGMPWLTTNPRLADLRWTKVTGFPNHLLFFRVAGEAVEFVRVLHGARDLHAILGG